MSIRTSLLSKVKKTKTSRWLQFHGRKSTKIDLDVAECMKSVRSGVDTPGCRNVKALNAAHANIYRL